MNFYKSKSKKIMAIMLVAMLLVSLLIVPVSATNNEDTKALTILYGMPIDSEGKSIPQVNVGNKVNLEFGIKYLDIKDNNYTAEISIINSSFSTATATVAANDVSNSTAVVKFENVIYSGVGNTVVLRVTRKDTEGKIVSSESLTYTIGECKEGVVTQEPTPQPEPEPELGDGTGLVFNAYAVLDGNGNAMPSVSTGEMCSIAVAMRDNRILDSEISDLEKQITVTPYSSSFSTPVRIQIDRKSSPDGKLTYTVLFHNVIFSGGDPKFNFDISYSGIDANGMLYPMNFELSQHSVNIGQAVTDTTSRVIVPRKISTGEGEVLAGSPFTLSVDAFNASTSAQIPNVTVKLGTLPDGFLAVGGSTSVFIGNIAPYGAITANFELQAKASITSGSYPITVIYTSTDSEITATQDIMVTVNQPERFEVSSLDVQEFLMMGDEGEITANLLNQGKSQIYNVTGVINSEQIANNGEKQFLGNVMAGSEDSISFYVMPMESGMISGTVDIVYENEKGDINTITKDFTMTVEEPYTDGMFEPDIMIPMEEEEKGISLAIWVALALVVAGVVIFIVIKRKKAKAEKKLEEEDADF